MVNFDQIFPILRIILFGLIIVIATMYSIPIIFLRRFHHRNNILTLNICLAIILCCLYWFIFYIMLDKNLYGTYYFLIESCVFVFIVPVLLTLEIPFSFVTVSINRFCSIVYHHKNIFKTKRWTAICILGQWVLGTICILPIWAGIQSYCGSPQWVEIYKFIFIVIIPFIIFLFVNILIYIHIRSSTHRIQPQSSAPTGNNSNDTGRGKISRRDIHLLRHMVLILSIFLGGWTPLYLLLAIKSQFTIDPTLSACFTIWCQLALLCDIIDLYLYNHEIRNYFKGIFLR